MPNPLKDPMQRIEAFLPAVLEAMVRLGSPAQVWGAGPDSPTAASLCEMRTAFIRLPLGVVKVMNACETLPSHNPPLGNVITRYKASQDFTFGFLMLANE